LTEVLDPWDVERAARAIDDAQALLITAGAGMGVDSGLPDFRGREGFWRAYPPFARLGLDFPTLANPRWFADDPALAWGFYGHRLNMYRAARPHAGHTILGSWAARMRRGYFVVTSNVDGQFEAAGFDAGRIHEIHGSIHHLQCVRDCGAGVFPGEPVEVAVDPETIRAIGPLPRCPGCGALARPNILMFGDWAWDSTRSKEQEARLGSWLLRMDGARLVIVECGAGLAIPTIRYLSERAARQFDATLIRINPREPEVPDEADVGLAAGARGALEAIDAQLAAK
jgi:NAD-dependent SIR2 family protein deacetylase